MTSVVVYSSDWCPYCMRAKQLLASKGVDFEEIRVDGQPVSFDAAVHASFLYRSGYDLDRRYGPSIARELRAVIRRLVPSRAFVA